VDGQGGEDAWWALELPEVALGGDTTRSSSARAWLQRRRVQAGEAPNTDALTRGPLSCSAAALAWTNTSRISPIVRW
jgi:hypothetical protein